MATTTSTTSTTSAAIGTPIDRRGFLASAAVMTIGMPMFAAAHRQGDTMQGGTMQGAQAMYGLIGKMTATAGQRDALVAILLEGAGDMPGCLSYIVALDPADANAIWITEAWDSKASHDASLALPVVKAAIAKAKPLIAGFGDGVTTTPVGGHGLTLSKAAR